MCIIYVVNLISSIKAFHIFLGVETTRRFLLEWLSFLHRYVPVGILEKPPQRMNERVPDFRGRGDLETLLSSPKCSDWVNITEMFLGKVPDGFAFVPKHIHTSSICANSKSLSVHLSKSPQRIQSSFQMIADVGGK